MAEVSVVIPSYNHAPFVAEAVRSVLDQSFADLELFVIDDGSTDGSLEILTGIDDPRVCVITQENRGAHAAINRGLEMASAPYLAILNSDDAYSPERLEKMLPVLKGDPSVGIVSSYIEVVDVAGRRLGVKHGYRDLEPWLLEAPHRSFRAGDDLRAALLTENYLATTSNFLLSRHWYEEVGPFRGLRYAHDWDFALRMANLARIELIPEALLRYRIHGGNTIRENQARMIFEICWCLAVQLPQHMDDGEWLLNTESSARRVEQLLYSIYTFNMDRVLNAMLLEDLSRNEDLALALLEPGNARRSQYLEYIQRHLSDASAGDRVPLFAKFTNHLKGLLGRRR